MYPDLLLELLKAQAIGTFWVATCKHILCFLVRKCELESVTDVCFSQTGTRMTRGLSLNKQSSVAVNRVTAPKIVSCRAEKRATLMQVRELQTNAVCVLLCLFDEPPS
jgi:hypothetical protein